MKTLKKLSSLLLVLFTVLSIWSAAGIEAAAESNLIPAATVTARIENYMKQCASDNETDRYWNKNLSEKKLKKLENYIDGITEHACTGKKHNRENGCTSNTFGGARQCLGFAKYLQWIAFDGAETKKIKAANLPDDYQFKPGDMIGWKNKNGSRHYVVVKRVEDDTLIVSQGNAYGRCRIVDNKTLKRSDAMKWIKNGKGGNAPDSGMVRTGPVAVGPLYTVKYNANLPNGISKSSLSGSMKASAMVLGETYTLRKNAFTISGYNFLGWNTKRDGSGQSFNDQQKVKNLAGEGETATLYAQWHEDYLIRCKKTATNLILKANGTTGYTKMMSYPCDKNVMNASKAFRSLKKGETLNAKAIYQNTVGQYWYQVTDQKGKTGFVYGGAAEVIGIPSEALSGNAKLSTKTPAVGKPVVVSGILSGKSVKLTSVKAMLTGSDKTAQTKIVKPNATKFDLAKSAIAKELKFEILKHGPGNLKLTIKLSAKSTDGKKLLNATKTVNKTVKFTEIGQYKVVFDANGGYGAPGAVKKTDQKNLTLPSDKPVYSGFQFLGWARKASSTSAEFEAGGVLNVDNTNGKNLKLYAIWEKAQTAGDIDINAENFPDSYFRDLVQQYDKDGNGSLSQSERDEVKTLYCTQTSSDGHLISDLKGIEYFTELINFSCEDNTVSILDLSSNTKLEYVCCRNNHLISLNVTNCAVLGNLICDHNMLTQLDLSTNTKLQNLMTEYNQLTSLDLSGNEWIDCVFAHHNSFKKLDVSKNLYLAGLLTGSEAVNALVLKEGIDYFRSGNLNGAQLYIDPDVVLNPTPDYPPEPSATATASAAVTETAVKQSNNVAIETDESETTVETAAAAITDILPDAMPALEQEDLESEIMEIIVKSEQVVDLADEAEIEALLTEEQITEDEDIVEPIDELPIEPVQVEDEEPIVKPDSDDDVTVEDAFQLDDTVLKEDYLSETDTADSETTLFEEPESNDLQSEDTPTLAEEVSEIAA